MDLIQPELVWGVVVILLGLFAMIVGVAWAVAYASAAEAKWQTKRQIEQDKRTPQE